MSDNWDKDLPFEGMIAKVNRKCHDFFLGRRRLARLKECYLFIVRFGPGVGVGADQEPGVGVGTPPPRLRCPFILKLESEFECSTDFSCTYYERSAKRVLRGLVEKSKYERHGPTRHDTTP